MQGKGPGIAVDRSKRQLKYTCAHILVYTHMCVYTSAYMYIRAHITQHNTTQRNIT